VIPNLLEAVGAPESMATWAGIRRALHKFDRSLSMIVRHDQCIEQCLVDFTAKGNFHLQCEHIWQIWAGSLARGEPPFGKGFLITPRTALR
jgi:hypothetical protein